MIEFEVIVASKVHVKYAEEISVVINESANERGTGIAVRSIEYISNKMIEGKAVIALEKKSRAFAGFCYIESWGDKKFAANSGLIISKNFRRMGLAAKVKEKAFMLSRQKYPNAKLFGLTTSLPVMKINSDLGYRPVTFSELTEDEEFWSGCKSCVNYDVLTRTHRKHCLCTGMLYDPNEKNKHQRKKFKDYKEIYRKWFRKRKKILLKRFKKEMIST